jgi:ABC-2 type transport system permease protein
MSLLPAPLVLLTWLRAKALIRGLFRALRTPKGIVALVGVMFVICMMLVPALIDSVRTPSAAEIEASKIARDRMLGLLPLGILGFALLSLVRGSGDMAFAFLPAEVDFLFPAPFTRRQLLIFKLAQRALPMLFGSLLLAFWMRRIAESWWALWIGVLLAFWFVHLLSLALALCGQIIGSERFRRWRLAGGSAILLAVLAGSYWVSRSLEDAGLLETLGAFATSPLGTILAAPGRPFAAIMTAPSILPGAAVPLAIALAMNLLLVVAILRLDANWLEAGAESSQRLAAKVEEVRRAGGLPAGVGLARLRLPSLPRLAGVGPLVWRSLLIGIRQGVRGLVVVAVLVGIVLLPMVIMRNSRDGGAPSAGGGGPLDAIGWIALGYMSLFLPQMLRLDFRADVDRMDVLKALPVSAWAVALAQCGTPALLVTLLQVPVACFVGFSSPLGVTTALAFLPALLGLNLLNASLENATFLLWPSRPSRGPGMQFSLGGIVGQFLKMLVLAVGVASAAGVGFALHAAGGAPLPLVGLAVAATLIAEAILAILLTASLFAAFDPAVEQAPDG